LSLTPGNQEIYSITSENYDACHEAMMAELDRIKKARIARAAIATVVEACADEIKPKGKRPCDCDRCYCGNPGSAAAVESWDTMKYASDLIRALAPKEPKP